MGHLQWCCEVCLWLSEWRHVGQMYVGRHIELVELVAHEFRRIASNEPVLTAYAKTFILYLLDNPNQACDVMVASTTSDDLNLLLTQAEQEVASLELENDSSPARISACPDLTRESKFMISARFNTLEMINNCKELKVALEKVDFSNILLVDANGGDQFGPMTMQYLKECDAMIGMITEDYAERTRSAYCSYYELKHYIENRRGCGTSQIQKFFPIKLCATWPPPSRGDDGAALCSLAFTQDLVWTVDMYNQRFDAEEVARKIAAHVPSARCNTFV